MSVQERTFDTSSLFSMHVFLSLYGKRTETEIASKAVFLAFVKFLLHIPSSSVPDAPVLSRQSPTGDLRQPRRHWTSLKVTLVLLLWMILSFF